MHSRCYQRANTTLDLCQSTQQVRSTVVIRPECNNRLCTAASLCCSRTVVSIRFCGLRNLPREPWPSGTRERAWALSRTFTRFDVDEVGLARVVHVYHRTRLQYHPDCWDLALALYGAQGEGM